MRRVAITFLVTLVAFAGSLGAAPIKVVFTDKEWAKLESFEGHSLSDAEKRFTQKKWREAVAAYDAFVMEFPESKAIPYTLIRKGLALENDDKRFKAIEAYQEVLDYFPNVIPFAAPALYYIGRCHQRNDDMDKALRHYAEMANDEDYATHPLAAHAICELARNLMKQKRVPDAIKYFRRVAVEFRKTNIDARRDAMPYVIGHYIRTKPSEPELRKFYIEAGAFHHSVHGIPDVLDNDWAYWSMVKGNVRHYGSFNSEQEKERKKHYGYWTPLLDGKFKENDDYRKDIADMFFLAFDLLVRHLVADQKGVSLLATLLEAVDRCLAGKEVERQFIRLGLLAPTATFEKQPIQIVFDFIARFELPDLQRCQIARRVSDASDKNGWIVEIGFSQAESQ